MEAAKSEIFFKTFLPIVGCALMRLMRYNFRTGDSQLADTIIEKACLEAIYTKEKIR